MWRITVFKFFKISIKSAQLSSLVLDLAQCKFLLNIGWESLYFSVSQAYSCSGHSPHTDMKLFLSSMFTAKFKVLFTQIPYNPVKLRPGKATLKKKLLNCLTLSELYWDPVCDASWEGKSDQRWAEAARRSGDEKMSPAETVYWRTGCIEESQWQHTPWTRVVPRQIWGCPVCEPYVSPSLFTCISTCLPVSLFPPSVTLSHSQPWAAGVSWH